MVIVGDSKQCIQSFAASDDEAFQKWKALPNTISMPLSINYRCPLIIQDIARRFVPQFEVFKRDISGILK
jgi:hypothetical protein